MGGLALLRNEGAEGRKRAHSKSVPKKRACGVPALFADRRNTTLIEDSVIRDVFRALELHNCSYVPDVCRCTISEIASRESARLNLSPYLAIIVLVKVFGR